MFYNFIQIKFPLTILTNLTLDTKFLGFKIFNKNTIGINEKKHYSKLHIESDIFTRSQIVSNEIHIKYNFIK